MIDAGAVLALAPGARGSLAGTLERVTSDSRLAGPGALFVALATDAEKARAHVEEARARGAVTVAPLRLALDADASVPDVEAFLAAAAELVAGRPTRQLKTVGVTGTNGKTTTTRLVAQALEALGAHPAWMGTGRMTVRGRVTDTPFTTPTADVVSAFARDALQAGATHLVMEVSSHALDRKRVDAVTFDVAAFTNLTRDHLDYHGSMQAYGAAKRRFFAELHSACQVVHVGDPFGHALAREACANPLTVAVDVDAAVRVRSFEQSAAGLSAVVEGELGVHVLASPLVGRHNLENLLVALGSLAVVGVAPGDAVRALADAHGAEGRLERVSSAPAVFVDYAHTDDALGRVLAALRPLTRGRLIVVFGCGGDRDRGKRPKMAVAATAVADLVVVTSDNPRTEAPEAIVAEILGGIDTGTHPRVEADALSDRDRAHAVVLDRRAAIRAALAAAREEDTVLLAGKGHEDYQVIGTTKVPFDDRVEARAALEALGRVA